MAIVCINYVFFCYFSDAAGPLFWAYEYGHSAGIQILEDIGVDPNARDALGKTPRMLGIENDKRNRDHMSLDHDTIEYDFGNDDYDDYDDEF